MTLYGMLDYGQGFDPLLMVKITPVFLSVYICAMSVFKMGNSIKMKAKYEH